jgi:hypothetical protein
MRLTLLSSDETSMLTNVMAPLLVPAAASRRDRISACCKLVRPLGANALHSSEKQHLLGFDKREKLCLDRGTKDGTLGVLRESSNEETRGKSCVK